MKENKRNMRERQRLSDTLRPQNKLNHHPSYYFFSQIHAAHHSKDAKHVSGERRPSRVVPKMDTPKSFCHLHLRYMHMKKVLHLRR